MRCILICIVTRNDEHVKTIYVNRYYIKKNLARSKNNKKITKEIVEKSKGKVSICRSCDGCGFFREYIVDIKCQNCSGSGYVDWIKRIIPKG